MLIKNSSEFLNCFCIYDHMNFIFPQAPSQVLHNDQSLFC